MPASDNSDLFADPGLARFYDLRSRPRADIAWCRDFARGAGSVLDLGCGTGEFAASLDGPARIVGVDAAAAMLDIARARHGGERVEWISGDARGIRLGRRFDLITMTGHSFQAFLSNEDQSAVLASIAAHLAPEGRFVFDTRNPAARMWAGRNAANTLRRLRHPDLGEIESWSEPVYDEATGILTSRNSYRIVGTGKTHTAELRIRFTSKEPLMARITEAGLRIDRWLGDWDSRPWTPDAPEIIPIGALA